MPPFGPTQGSIPFTLVSTGSGADFAVITSRPTQITGIFAGNINAAPRYLKLYDVSGASTSGLGLPVLNLIIPGNTAGGGSNPTPGGLLQGAQFYKGVTMLITTNMALADASAANAGDCNINILYQ